jgi:integrase
MAKARKSLAFEHWPELDQQLWQQAVRHDDLLTDSGPAARWAPRTRETVCKGYGDWLFWLKSQCLLDPAESPDARCSPSRLLAYVEAMRGLSPATIANRVIALERALCALLPRSNRSQLRTLINNLPKRGVTSRKRARLQDPADLLELGLKLMRDAERGVDKNTRKNACTYRDGLEIALLAMRPFRRRNFAEITLHRHLVRERAGWRIHFASGETKTKEPIDVPFPIELVPHLERYLVRYRPVLMGGRYCGDRLWIGYRFKPQAAHTIGITIAERTEQAFGKRVNFHLFRDCAATSIAVHDPDHVRIAAAVLGHRSFATTERHYNLATSLKAARDYQAEVQRLRMPRSGRSVNGSARAKSTTAEISKREED